MNNPCFKNLLTSEADYQTLLSSLFNRRKLEAEFNSQVVGNALTDNERKAIQLSYGKLQTAWTEYGASLEIKVICRECKTPGLYRASEGFLCLKCLEKADIDV